MFDFLVQNMHSIGNAPNHLSKALPGTGKSPKAMTKDPSPRTIADELKEMLYPPLPGDGVDFAALVGRFNKACAQSPPGVPDVARAQNEMANHLLVLAESKQDKSLLKANLHGLLDSGRLGRQAACRFLRSGSVSLEQLAPMVASLPVRLRLHLLQELLRTPREEEKALLQWARQQLVPLKDAPVNDVLLFLDESCRLGDELIHPVRRIILDGPFPAWLEKRIANSPAGNQFSTLCRAAHTLRSPSLVDGLAQALSGKRIQPDPEDAALLAGAGNQANAHLLKAFQTMLGSRSEGIALAGAEGLARAAWPKSGKALRLLLQKYPAQRARLAVKAAVLPHACLMDFLKGLGKEDRADMTARIFAAMARLDPDFTMTRLERAGKLDKAHVQRLKEYVLEQKKRALGGLKRRTMPPAPAGPAGLNRPGLLKRLFAEKKQTLTEVLEMVHSPKDKDLPGSEFEGALTSRNLSRLRLAGSRFHKAQCIKVTFSSVNFTDCAFSEVDFTGCTFNNCVFVGAILTATAFAGCEFKNCDFSGAAFENCSLEESRFDRCFLSGMLMKNSALGSVRIRQSSLNLCQFQECSITSTRLRHAALAHCQFIGCALDGCEFHDCGLSHCQFVTATLSSSLFSGTTLESCSMQDASSDAGVFEQARLADIIRKSTALEMKPGDLPEGIRKDASGLLPLIDLWSRRLEITRYHAPLLRNNQRRLEHSARRMAGEDCFWMVPYLLQSDIVDQKFKLASAPPCRLEGYTPSYTALSLAARYFKGVAPTAPTSRAVVIQGLFAMGSLGSVAQTRASDVDYWVCYDAATATPQMLAGLRAKLDAITNWAMETFELEAYFFLMSMDEVRGNEFGFSDKESSGSAQALMLKEEFYRTVVPVAGLHPAWWVTPPGASEKAHKAWVAAANTVPRSGASRFVDMGRLSPIPRDEFFGASLWQIVKALHSPYKSVMKLGLLEKYSSRPDALMLADQIKQSVVRGQSEIPYVDPYVALFRELRGYYRSQGDKETVGLLTEALLLKAKVGDFDFFFGFPSIFEESSLLDFLFGPGRATENRVRSLGQSWSFAKSLQVGDTVSHFMTATYKRIQAKLGKGTTGRARITPEDMTRLGRQISANFARKKNKVVRVPFLGTQGYPELRFLAEKAPGKRTVWAVQGRTRAEGKKSVKNTEPLSRSHDPATLMAWLVMNRLFTPKTLVDGESSIAPMSVVDIKNALAQLHAFFPHDATFELDPDSYLDDEFVVRAMLLVNLAQAPEANQVLHVDVIYATSLGEVFCVPVSKPDQTISKSVRSWLSMVLPHDASRLGDIKAVYPKRGQCPRLPGV